MTDRESLQAKVERYLSYGYQIKPNGAVFDPYTGAEVDWLDTELQAVKNLITA